MANDANDLERYRRDEMTPAERHAFEKRALEDPFLRDALSGSESVTPEAFAEDVGDLNRRLVQHRATWFSPIRIAAGIVIVAAVGWLVYRTAPVEPESLAELKKDSTAIADSTSKLLTLASPKDSTKESDKSIAKTPALKPSEPQQTSTQPAPSSTAGQSASGVVARTEPAKAEPEKTDPAKAEQAKTELAKTEPAKTAAAKADSIATAKTEVAEEQQEDKSVKKEAAAPAAADRRAAGLNAQSRDRNADADSFAADDDSAKKSDIMVYTSESNAPEGTYVFATPVGGVSFTRYLEENQRIPESAREARIRGKVTATFDVTATGSMSGLRVLKSLGYGCDEELLRLVRNGPAWSPTLRDGKPVPSTVIVKLEFAADR